MRNKISLTMLAAAVLVSFSGQAMSQTQASDAPAHQTLQGTVFELPLQGIKIEMNASGDWDRIFATGVQPVEFPDRRGILTAQRIAEQRAKGEIVRFFSQEVSAETVVNELESTSEVSTRQTGSGGEVMGREAQRTLSTSLNEVFRSFSSGTLRGVMVLEAGYDETREEAWVEVGISRNSARMAAQTQDAMNNPTREPVPVADTEDLSQPGEVRRGQDLP